jgi:hypothetical protein
METLDDLSPSPQHRLTAMRRPPHGCTCGETGAGVTLCNGEGHRGRLTGTRARHWVGLSDGPGGESLGLGSLGREGSALGLSVVEGDHIPQTVKGVCFMPRHNHTHTVISGVTCDV